MLIESVNQMRIVADGYIQPLQEVNQSLGQCVDGLIDEVDRSVKSWIDPE